MRKLFSALAVVLVFAMAFTITASAATGDKVWTPTDGKYEFTYDLSEAGLTNVADGTMFGMLVLEELNPNFETLDDSDIKYIDQVNSDDGSISFGPFAPISSTASQYYVYIGGGKLNTVKNIGTLSKTTAPPTTYDVIFMADGAQVAKITKNVGETLAFADFPDVPAKTGYTGVWSVTTDITSATTVTAVYTAETPATYDVIFMADGAQVAKITKNVGETLAFADFPDVPAKAGFTGVWSVTTDITSTTTVTAIYTADSTGDDDDDTTVLYGDVNGDGQIKNNDLSTLARHIAEWPDYPLSIINQANADVTADGQIKNGDLSALARHIAEWPDYLTLPYVK